MSFVAESSASGPQSGRAPYNPYHSLIYSIYSIYISLVTGRRRRKGMIKREGQAIKAAEEKTEERKGR